MAEQEEYKLPEISEEQIEKAAMPVGKRVNEDVSEETQYIELDDNKDELKPLQEDDVKEDFETSQKVVEETKDKSEVEKKLPMRRTESTKQ